MNWYIGPHYLISREVLHCSLFFPFQFFDMMCSNNLANNNFLLFMSNHTESNTYLIGMKSGDSAVSVSSYVICNLFYTPAQLDYYIHHVRTNYSLIFSRFPFDNTVEKCIRNSVGVIAYLRRIQIHLDMDYLLQYRCNTHIIRLLMLVSQ